MLLSDLVAYFELLKKDCRSLIWTPSGMGLCRSFRWFLLAIYVSLSSGGSRESSRIRAPCTAVQSQLLNNQIVLDLLHKAAVLGRRILPAYFFSIWWFHTDVSPVPLVCKDMEHLWRVCLGLSTPNRTGFLEKEHSWKKQHAFFLFTSNSGIEICPLKSHSIASQVRSAHMWHFDIWACSHNSCCYRTRLCVSVQAVTFAPCNQWSAYGIRTAQRCLGQSAKEVNGFKYFKLTWERGSSVLNFWQCSLNIDKYYPVFLCQNSSQRTIDRYISLHRMIFILEIP